MSVWLWAGLGALALVGVSSLTISLFGLKLVIGQQVQPDTTPEDRVDEILQLVDELTPDERQRLRDELDARVEELPIEGKTIDLEVAR